MTSDQKHQGNQPSEKKDLDYNPPIQRQPTDDVDYNPPKDTSNKRKK